ncbi:MAG: adenylate/guanylate cyclase domain-containing protein [Chloroflexota bacterium]
MNPTLKGEKLRSHLPPLISAVAAVVMLILSPLWAYRWTQIPFLGVSIEQNNVVSQIQGSNWAAREQGAQYLDRLVEINGQPVPDIRDVERVLLINGYQPVEATFLRPSGEHYTLEITPVRPSVSDIVSLFVVPYLVGILFLAIGLWAYRLKPQLWESRALALFASGVCMMLVTFLDISMTHHATIVWSFAILLTAGGIMYLALVFPKPVRFVRANPRLRYLPWGVMAILVPVMFMAVYFPPDPYFYTTAWQTGYLFIMLGFALLIGMLITRIIKGESPIVRQQSRVIFFGVIIGLLPVLSYLAGLILGLLPQFHAWLYFPPLVLFPLSVSYAILRYRLLDVDAVLVRVLTYVLMTVVVIVTFYALLAALAFIFGGAIAANNPLVIAAYLFILGVGLTPLRNIIQTAIDRLFYRAPADYRRVLTNLSQSLTVTPKLDQTLRLLEEQLQQTLAPERFAIYLYNDDLGEYFPHATREDSAPPYQVHSPLIRLLASSSTPIWVPLDGPLPPELKDSATPTVRLRGFTFVPLRYEGRLIGFLSLGPRRSGDPYTRDDLDFLAAVASQSTLALENARLFTNLRRTLDQTLEMKNLMDDIFASVATGIITTDVKDQITLFNRAAAQIFGIPVDDVLGHRLSKALPGFGTELEQATASVVKENNTILNTELSSTSPTRGNLYLRLSLSPLRDAYLVTKGTTIVFEDLTERYKLEAERELIRQTFGRVVAPRIRDRLLGDPGNLQLRGAKQIVTILFADLSGFTTYSEKHDPELVFSVLNSYLSLAAQAILEQEGTLDKFMGDAVLAIWNSPDLQEDHAIRAVRAAHEIMRRAGLAHLHFDRADQRMLFRIGISTGPAIIGNVGTAELFNYTAIGDTVNIAERLQKSAQPGEILLENSTHDIVADHVIAESLEPITVKGREQPVEVHLLKGLK